MEYDAARAVQECRSELERGSKSFAFAGRLLAPRARDDAAVLYTWCRRADDRIDESPADQVAQQLSLLRQELDDVYAGRPLDDIRLVAFQDLIRRRNLPKLYPQELLRGMQMDVEGRRYETLEELLEYCHCVAGVVGLMMCHVLGVRSDAALPSAARLGWAMQLTNICRDVQEDWQRGRIYLPLAMLREQSRQRGCQAAAFAQAEALVPSEAIEPDAVPIVAAVTRLLLASADQHYHASEGGLAELGPRVALAIATSRLIYAEIGQEIAKQDYDPSRGRAVVPLRRKVELLARAGGAGGSQTAARFEAPHDVEPPSKAMALSTRHARALPRVGMRAAWSFGRSLHLKPFWHATLRTPIELVRSPGATNPIGIPS